MQITTGEICIRFLPELIVLQQCQCPGFENVLWLYKAYHWGKLGEEYMGTLYNFLQLLVNLKLFQNKKLLKYQEEKTA